MKMSAQQSEEFKVDGFLVWIEDDGPTLWIENEQNWKENIGIPLLFGLVWSEVEHPKGWKSPIPENVKEFCSRLVKNSAFL